MNKPNRSQRDHPSMPGPNAATGKKKPPAKKALAKKKPARPAKQLAGPNPRTGGKVKD